ncbi:hypothetical protein TPAR_04423 [Tolypocladium paradoxum]|uniref:Uncharacterized protein n=1 Tax=Tolypocladium paradoxum TaxID=94208 RepID=A0A2S4KZ00_9HYPO|nr:hypothetical protein TPAR_04423 [Tolypocladium paradoxum]
MSGPGSVVTEASAYEYSVAAQVEVTLTGKWRLAVSGGPESGVTWDVACRTLPRLPLRRPAPVSAAQCNWRPAGWVAAVRERRDGHHVSRPTKNSSDPSLTPRHSVIGPDRQARRGNSEDPEAQQHRNMGWIAAGQRPGLLGAGRSERKRTDVHAAYKASRPPRDVTESRVTTGEGHKFCGLFQAGRASNSPEARGGERSTMALPAPAAAARYLAAQRRMYRYLATDARWLVGAPRRDDACLWRVATGHKARVRCPSTCIRIQSQEFIVVTSTTPSSPRRRGLVTAGPNGSRIPPHYRPARPPQPFSGVLARWTLAPCPVGIGTRHLAAQSKIPTFRDAALPGLVQDEEVSPRGVKHPLGATLTHSPWVGPSQQGPPLHWSPRVLFWPITACPPPAAGAFFQPFSASARRRRVCAIHTIGGGFATAQGQDQSTARAPFPPRPKRNRPPTQTSSSWWHRGRDTEETHHRSDRAPAPLVCVILSNPRKRSAFPLPALLGSARALCSELGLSPCPAAIADQQATHLYLRNSIARALRRIRPTVIRSLHRGLILPTRHNAASRLSSIRSRTTRFRPPPPLFGSRAPNQQLP